MYESFPAFVEAYRAAYAVPHATYAYAVSASMLLAFAGVVTWVVSIRSYSFFPWGRYAWLSFGLAALVWFAIAVSWLSAWSWDIPTDAYGRELVEYAAKVVGVDDSKASELLLEYANTVGPVVAANDRPADFPWVWAGLVTGLVVLIGGLALVAREESELAAIGCGMAALVVLACAVAAFATFDNVPRSIMEGFGWFVRSNGRSALELAPVLP